MQSGRDKPLRRAVTVSWLLPSMTLNFHAALIIRVYIGAAANLPLYMHIYRRRSAPSCPDRSIDSFFLTSLTFVGFGLSLMAMKY